MSIVSEQTGEWLSSPAGQYVLEKEQLLFDEAVFDLFGFNALQMGYLHADFLRNSRIPNHFVASQEANSQSPHHLCCQGDFLPLADMSLDLLLLPHCLEFSERPHQTLREAARVIVHEGHLLISGFNPMSSWGAAARFKKLSTKSALYPWSGKFIGLTRLKDWLTLLGFEVILVEMTCFTPPFEQIRWQQRFACMDKMGPRFSRVLGGVYFIVAKKRVVGMTPIKPHWKASSLKVGLAVRQPKSHTTQSEQIE